MKPGKQAGFTYLTALVLIAVSAAAAAAAAQAWSISRQREKEAELMWIGSQFVQAIGLYYQRSPGVLKEYPAKLEDLLEDKRQLATQRYLRRIYRDPMTGKAEWGIVSALDGRVMGVYSLSDARPIRKQVSAPSVASPDAQRYSDWRFAYEPPAVRAAGR